MRKIIVSEWISLDGVSDDQSMPEWFFPYHSDERGRVIMEGILACDGFLLGRKTYEMLAPYWSAMKNNEMGVADQLNNGTKYVVSTQLKKADWNNSVIIRENITDRIRALKQEPGKDILIMGSATLVRTLMAENLIDEYRFLVQPVIMGSGQRFFLDGMHSKTLELTESRSIGQGVLQLTYRPILV